MSSWVEHEKFYNLGAWSGSKLFDTDGNPESIFQKVDF